MTKTLTPAEQLARLPESVQERLWRIARLAAGMSAAEKEHLAHAVAGAALGLALRGSDESISGAECLSAFAVIVDEIGKVS